jgi:CheY-like chemotaxis protein
MKFKNNISLKAGLSYAIVAIAMILIIALVYVNTRSLNAISTSVGEYARMQQHADSALAGMMADERESLRQLNEAMALSRRPGALRRRMDSLNSGKDSVVVHSKATETHHVSTTTVEVARSRHGFFHRLADLFHSSHTDTVSVRRDSTLAGVDTVARPVDVSHRVASILADAEREDHKKAQHDAVSVNSEMRYLKALTDAIAREQARKVTLLQAQERKIVSRSLADARRSQERLVMQLALLAGIAILLGAFLVWRIRRDVTREAAYRQALQDILLVDIEMPEMSGIDFIQHIDHHGITTVAMTAHDASIIPQLHAAGFDACLLKPVKAEELAHILGSDEDDGDDDSSYHTTTQSNEQTDFLALFSDGEDRRQILEAVHTEVADFKHRLQSAIESSADKNTASTPPDRDLIVRTAHKLLPIAKMLNLDCVPILEQLTPQQIAAVSDREVTAKVKKVIQSLANSFQ